MKLYKVFSFLILLVLFSGCASKVNVVEYSKLDTSEKSITVPAGGNYVLTLIKQGLIQDGWDLQIDDSTMLTVKNKDKEETGINYKTKYRMLVATIIMGPENNLVHVNFSLIDNKNGKEVMTYFVYPNNPKEVADTVLNWFRGIKEDDKPKSITDKVMNWVDSIKK